MALTFVATVYTALLTVIDIWLSERMYCTGADSIVVKSPIENVREKGMLAIHCQVWNLDNDEVITITRKLGEDITTLSYDDHVQPDVEDRIFLAVRRMSGGSIVSFLTIYDVTRADEGEYFCKVISTDTIAEVARESVVIKVQYLPSELICNPNQAQRIQAGTLVTLNCTSQSGYPPVRMAWGRTGSSILERRYTVQNQNGVVFSELSFVASKYDNGAVFLCSVTSPAYPSITETCHAGPFTVITDPNSETDVNTNKPAEKDPYIHNREDKDRDDRYVIHNNPTITSISAVNKCKQTCPALNKPMKFWVITTVIGTSIAFVFLIVGVYFALKLYRMGASTKKGTERNGVPLYPLTDGVYEKVDCRNDNSSIMYMTLEKLRKPSNLLVSRELGVPDHVMEGTYSGTPTAYVT